MQVAVMTAMSAEMDFVVKIGIEDADPDVVMAEV
jgi:hypothetical protein